MDPKPCRNNNLTGALPALPADPSAMRVLTATGIAHANGSFPLNSAGDPLPAALMFHRKYAVLGVLVFKHRRSCCVQHEGTHMLENGPAHTSCCMVDMLRW